MKTQRSDSGLTACSGDGAPSAFVLLGWDQLMKVLRTSVLVSLLAFPGCKSSEPPPRRAAASPAAADAAVAAPPRPTADAAPSGAAPLPAPKAGSSTLRVLTYNTGLAVGVVQHVTERAKRIASAMANSQTDLACLQEVWLAGHWDGIQRAAAASMPHAIRPEARGSAADDTCEAGELAPVLQCAGSRCAGQNREALAVCMVQHCAGLARTLSPSCTTCLTRDPTRSLEQVSSECEAPPGATPRPARAKESARGGDNFVYGGSTGLALLASDAVVERDFLELPSERVARGVIYAKLRREGMGDVHAFCTHLATDLGLPRVRGTWKEEQSAQIDELVAFVSRKTAQGGTVLVLGDFNTGPAAGGNQPRWPDHYRRLVEVGRFQSPYAARTNPSCTFCFANPLVGGSQAGLLIDHVLIGRFAGTVTAERRFDAPIEVSNEGRRTQTALSDHYGVAVTLRNDGA